MAGVLDLLGQLEEEEEQKRPSRQKTKKLPSSYVSSGARKTSRPPPLAVLNDHTLRPPTPSGAPGERSPSIAPSIGGDSARRISFAEFTRPPARKIWIPTKGESLASGFIYDPRLNKYSVSEEEWKQFNQEIIEAANVKSAWLWPVQRSSVIKKVGKDLLYVESSYDGKVKGVLKKFNHFWKNKKQFTVWLELPTPKGQIDLSDEVVGDSPEDKEKAKRDAKRFRIVIVPVDRDSRNGRAGSVYSRTSSISKSIRGEGAGVRHDDVDRTDADDELQNDDENDKSDVPSPELDDSASPMSPQSDYQDAKSTVEQEERTPRSPQIKFSEPTS